ncbi:helix-turn-helix transcriptional regulator [Enterobacterales bacterium AE_CKDN230030158-1A_HGKHYDSX7]
MLCPIVKSELEMLSEPDEKLSLVVEQHIHFLLPRQQCTLERVALILDVHPRTLQRHLANDGVIFEDLLDKIRRLRSMQLLGRPDMTVGRITQELGYRSISSFGRAHQRWFGMPPIEHQRLLRA